MENGVEMRVPRGPLTSIGTYQRSISRPLNTKTITSTTITAPGAMNISGKNTQK